MGNNSVLIVDDDRDLLLGLGIRLRAAGYHVTIALDAITAIAAARREPPDLIVLDIGLPGGDGLTVLRSFKFVASLASIPVIILTARDMSLKEKAMSSGAYAFFQKPADNDELLATIVDALREGDRAVND